MVVSLASVISDDSMMSDDSRVSWESASGAADVSEHARPWSVNERKLMARSVIAMGDLMRALNQFSRIDSIAGLRFHARTSPRLMSVRLPVPAVSAPHAARMVAATHAFFAGAAEKFTFFERFVRTTMVTTGVSTADLASATNKRRTQSVVHPGNQRLQAAENQIQYKGTGSTHDGGISNPTSGSERVTLRMKAPPAPRLPVAQDGTGKVRARAQPHRRASDVHIAPVARGFVITKVLGETRERSENLARQTVPPLAPATHVARASQCAHEPALASRRQSHPDDLTADIDIAQLGSCPKTRAGTARRDILNSFRDIRKSIPIFVTAVAERQGTPAVQSALGRDSTEPSGPLDRDHCRSKHYRSEQRACVVHTRGHGRGRPHKWNITDRSGCLVVADVVGTRVTKRPGLARAPAAHGATLEDGTGVARAGCHRNGTPAERHIAGILGVFVVPDMVRATVAQPPVLAVAETAHGPARQECTGVFAAGRQRHDRPAKAHGRLGSGGFIIADALAMGAPELPEVVFTPTCQRITGKPRPVGIGGGCRSYRAGMGTARDKRGCALAAADTWTSTTIEAGLDRAARRTPVAGDGLAIVATFTSLDREVGVCGSDAAAVAAAQARCRLDRIASDGKRCDRAEQQDTQNQAGTRDHGELRSVWW
jgi:hypothetical protein